MKTGHLALRRRIILFSAMNQDCTGLKIRKPREAEAARKNVFVWNIAIIPL